MSFIKGSPFSSLLKTASVAAAAISIAAPLAAQANTTVNATQLSIQVAPISISGTKLGAEASAAGAGLTNANSIIPTITSVGGITAGEAPTTAVDSTFSYVVSARSADAAVTSGSLSDTTTLFGSLGTFGSQTAKYSGGIGTNGTIALAGDGAPTVVAATNSGVTATAIFSTTTNTDLGESLVRRIATSGTDQTTSTSSRQGSSYGLSGSGLTAVTGGATVATTAAGAVTAVGSTTGGTSQAGVSFSRTETQLLGQASADLAATSTDVTAPGYGITSVSMGGTGAGAITGGDINALGVAAGSAGSTSTLSVVQSYTAF